MKKSKRHDIAMEIDALARSLESLYTLNPTVRKIVKALRLALEIERLERKLRK